MRKWISIEDVRLAAAAFLPRAVWDFVEGGTAEEALLRRNRESFHKGILLPTAMSNLTSVDTRRTVLGTEWALPFGIAPMGVCAAVRQHADAALARAAHAARIPFVLSGSATATVEDIAAVSSGTLWCQLYPARDLSITFDQLERAAASGVQVLVLTVDVPVQARRRRDLHNGWPNDISWPAKFEALRHPEWLWNYIRHGPPRLAGWEKYTPRSASAIDIARLFSAQHPAPQSWSFVEELRRRWPGKLVLKGILNPDDAARCVELGVDGIMISNHGGRQIDTLPTPLEVLPEIVSRLDKGIAVMVDGGIRSGSDVLVALCSGADFVFVGRPMLYGVAASLRNGPGTVIGILEAELAIAMLQLGIANLEGATKDRLFKPFQ